MLALPFFALLGALFQYLLSNRAHAVTQEVTHKGDRQEAHEDAGRSAAYGDGLPGNVQERRAYWG